ncbi:MAG: hypothetical protein NTV87_00330 [Ignavibacteriae bacterium]|nr:hypothetical protein [Ignavibacteriota bacterium]
MKKYFLKYWNFRTTVTLLLLFSFSAVSFAVDMHSCMCKPEKEVKVEKKSCCQKSSAKEEKSCGTDLPDTGGKTNEKQCEKKDKKEKKDCNNCGKCSFEKNEFETPVSTTSGNSTSSETVIFNTSNESIYDHTDCHRVSTNISPPGAPQKKYISALRI